MTEFEIAAELFGGTNQAFVAWLATRPELDRAGTAVQLNAFSAHKAAEAQIARCHAITGHGLGRCMICDAWPCSCVWEDAPQPAQSGVNPVPLQNTLERICDQALRQSVTIIPDRAADPCDPWVLANRISVLEHRLSAMTQERDHALLRMEAAIATSNGLIDAEVQRRIAKNVRAIAGFEDPPPDAQPGPLPCSDPAPDPDAPTKAAPFPASALRFQRQAIGLLSTADSGKVRLGGYAPTL